MELARMREIEEQKRERDVFVFETDYGDIVIVPLQEAAATTVREIQNLINRGFYDGLTFHYVDEGKMIQGGDITTRLADPSDAGSNPGPGYNLDAEFNDTPHEPGVLSMARTSDPNSAGSQFFICLEKVPHLDGQYTAFGRTADDEAWLLSRRSATWLPVLPTGPSRR